MHKIVIKDKGKDLPGSEEEAFVSARILLQVKGRRAAGELGALGTVQHASRCSSIHGSTKEGCWGLWWLLSCLSQPSALPAPSQAAYH